MYGNANAPVVLLPATGVGIAYLTLGNTFTWMLVSLLISLSFICIVIALKVWMQPR